MYQGQGQRFVSVVREKVASPNNVIEDWPLVSLFGAKAHVKRKKISCWTIQKFLLQNKFLQSHLFPPFLDRKEG